MTARGARKWGRVWPDLRAAILRFGDDPSAWRTATRASVTLAVPLLTLVAVGHPELTLYPTFGAFAAVYGRQPGAADRLRTRAGAGLWLTICVTAGAAVAISPTRAWLVLPLAALAGALGTVLSGRGRWVPPGALFAVFAVAACGSIPSTAARLPIAAALAAGTVLLAVVPDLARVASRRLRGLPRGASVDGRRAPDVAIARAAVATGAAPVVAGLVANAAGTARPYWAMVAAVAATTGVSTTARLARGIQRVLGTVAGIAVAAAVLAFAPPVWLTVVLAITLQGCAELLVGRNYALALTLITPLALLMAELAQPQSAGALLRERLVATVLGAACGMLVTVAVDVPRSPFSRRHVRT